MKLKFRKTGTGDPFIILHGLFGSSDNWLPIAKKMAAYFTVYLPDLRNHGNSPHRNSHTYFDLKNDLLEFMNEHQIEQAVLLGHSMGGKTLMFFATDYPERVKALLIADVAPKNYSKLKKHHKQKAFHEMIVNTMSNFDFSKHQNRTEINRALLQDIKEDAYRQILLKNIRKNKHLHCFEWKLNHKTIQKNLLHIMDGMDEKIVRKERHNFPVLFIKGEHSNYITLEDEQLICKIFPKAKVTSISESGHWIHAEQPQLLIKSILDFTLHKS